MESSVKSSEYTRHYANKIAVLNVEFKRFVINARRVSSYKDAVQWFHDNCDFDSQGNCYYHGGRPDDRYMFVPISLDLADRTAPYAELILHERALHLQRLRKD